MLTVRFPSGVSIQYNSANYAIRQNNGYTDLYTKKDGEWVAQVPTAGCIVESIPACRVYRGDIDPATLGEQVLEQLKTLRGSTLQTLKKRLEKFDSRTHSWKP